MNSVNLEFLFFSPRPVNLGFTFFSPRSVNLGFTKELSLVLREWYMTHSIRLKQSLGNQHPFLVLPCDERPFAVILANVFILFKPIFAFEGLLNFSFPIKLCRRATLFMNAIRCVIAAERVQIEFCRME